MFGIHQFRYLDRLWLKFAAVALFSLLPVGIMLSFVIEVKNKDIDFASKEIIGNNYQRELQRVLVGVVEYGAEVVNQKLGTSHEASASKEIMGNRYQRDLQRVLVGVVEYGAEASVPSVPLISSSQDSQVSEKMKKLERQIDADINSLAMTDGEIGGVLGFTQEELSYRSREEFTVANLRKKWEELKAPTKIAPDNTPYASIRREQVSSIDAHVRAMITHAGDSSNLILDPDLDSYYLMDATLLAVPQLESRIIGILSFVDKSMNKKIDLKDRIEIASLIQALNDADVARLVNSTRVAINEDANFYGISATLKSNTEPLLQRIQANSQKLTEDFNAFVYSEDSDQTISRAAASALIKESLDLLYVVNEFHIAALKELDVILGMRLASLQKDKTRVFQMTAASIFLGFTIGFYLIKNILCKIYSINAATARISKGELELPGIVSGNDELSELAKSVELMTRSFRSSKHQELENSATLIRASAEALESSTRHEQLLQSFPDRLFRLSSEGKIVYHYTPPWDNDNNLPLLEAIEKTMLGEFNNTKDSFSRMKSLDVLDLISGLDSDLPGEENKAAQKDNEGWCLFFDGYFCRVFERTVFEKNVIEFRFVLNQETGEASCVTRDVTEQRVALETIEIQRAQMMTASKFAALGEVAGRVAHEINSPLSVIKLNAEDINQNVIEIKEILSSLSETHKATESNKAECIIDDTNTCAKNIENMVDRIAKIIRGLQSFSRNSTKDSFVSTSVKSIVDDTIAICEANLKNKEVPIEVCIEKGLEVACRATELSQVFINLINNACDAIENSEEKWIKFEARAVNVNYTEADGNASQKTEVLFSITDAGRGIPAAVREKLGQPFFTTKAIGKGTGLGLSVSRGIAEGHGGRFWIDADCPNTRFCMQIPLIQEDAHNTKSNEKTKAA